MSITEIFFKQEIKQFLCCIVCSVNSLYLIEALPSCSRVCQGNQLFLHLINPFFNPAIHTTNRVTQMLSAWNIHHRLFAMQLNCHWSYLSSVICRNHLNKQALSQKKKAAENRCERSSEISNNHCQNQQEQTQYHPIKHASLRVTEERLLSEGSNMKSTNQISVSHCCD